jgi:hypothetical protein
LPSSIEPSDLNSPIQETGGRADTPAMRLAAAIVFLGAVAILGGCAPGANDELLAPIEDVALPDSPLGCEWGSSSFEHEPKSWVGCWEEVPGKLAPVSRRLRSRLEAQGFDVSSRRSTRSVELTGVRGDVMLCVDVHAAGFVRGRNTAPSDVEISPGEVFVDIWAAEARESPSPAGDARCAELPPSPEDISSDR